MMKINGKIYDDFYKEDDNERIWWTRELREVNGELAVVRGKHLYSFDKVKIYNFFQDYPQNMTAEEVEIFKAENPTLAKLR